MTSFSFRFEQLPGGTMLMRMAHGVSKDATAAERQLHDHVWNSMADYCGRNKIGLVSEPEGAI